MSKPPVSVVLLLVAAVGLLVLQPSNATSNNTIESASTTLRRLRTTETSTAAEESSDGSGPIHLTPSHDILASGRPSLSKDIITQEGATAVLPTASADRTYQSLLLSDVKESIDGSSNTDTTPLPHATVDVLREKPTYVILARATADTLREKPTSANLPHATIDVLRNQPVVVTASDNAGIWVKPYASVDVLRAREESPRVQPNGAGGGHVTSTMSAEQLSMVHIDSDSADSPSAAVPINPFQRVFYLSRPKRTSSSGGSRAMSPGVFRTAASQSVEAHATGDVLRTHPTQTPLPITSKVRGTSLLELDEADSDMPLMLADQL